MMDFSFEQSPWELYVEKLHGDKVSASLLLSLLEGESEEAVDDAFADLEQRGIALDISALPLPAVSGEMGQRLALEQKLAAAGLTPTALPEDDPLGLYLQELAAIPAFGDIRLLGLELAEANRAGKPADHLRTRLMNLSLSRVVELAGEYTGRGVLLLDLIQEGSLGLWQATEGWQGEDFEAGRDWWIRQYMARAITLSSRNAGVGERMRGLMEAYRAADRTLLARLGRNPVLEEIALELQLKPEDAQQVEQMVNAARLLEQAKQAGQPKEETSEDDQAVENTAYYQSRQRIGELLSTLSEEDARLLSLRFGLEGGKPMSPQEAGSKLGLTADEVVAREAAALAQLRRER